MNRNLDGSYFRVERNGKFESLCFSDLTEEEMDQVLDNKNRSYCVSLCKHLAYVLKALGNEFDIVGEE